MAEPLKNMYDERFLREFGQIIHTVHKPFSVDAFVQIGLDKHWEALTLKERMRNITLKLGELLPSTYKETIDILLIVNESCYGFPYLILPDYVEVFGQAPSDWEYSMNALEQFTSHSSAEFAVRPFIIHDPERMMKQMLLWAESENEHVRRLASEGCRPLLPWGQVLQIFKQDPTPIVAILEVLKQDESLYVRKSVANNINDIAKNHPRLVIQLAQQWIGKHPHTDWIIRHGCRTLIRKADPEVLDLFGYAQIASDTELVTEASILVTPDKLKIGEQCELSYSILIREGDKIRIRIEYGIEFVKASGKSSLKKFLLSDKTVAGGTKLQAKRTHRWADLSTRRHYPGVHRISLYVNGYEAAYTDLMLNPS